MTKSNRKPKRTVPGSKIAKVGAFRLSCSEKGCRGLMWRVDLSRLEEALGHEGYECDSCGVRIKTIPDSE